METMVSTGTGVGELAFFHRKVSVRKAESRTINEAKKWRSPDFVRMAIALGKTSATDFFSIARMSTRGMITIVTHPNTIA